MTVPIGAVLVDIGLSACGHQESFELSSHISGFFYIVSAASLRQSLNRPLSLAAKPFLARGQQRPGLSGVAGQGTSIEGPVSEVWAAEAWSRRGGGRSAR